MADCYTELEKAVVVLVDNFYKYVSKHSLVRNKISKSSFRKMLQRELNHMLTVRPARSRGAPGCVWGVPGPGSGLGGGLRGAPPLSAPSTPAPPQDTGNRKAADKLIQNLDANHDGRISFDEYWTLIGGITSPIANLIRQQEQQSGS